MVVPTLFLSWNRLEFTKRSYASLESTTHPIEITIFDNGSTDGSAQWLRKRKTHKRLRLSDTNKGMNYPLVRFLEENAGSKYVAKMDNDTIVEPAWMDILIEHMEEHNLWACAAWHWRPEGPAGTFWEWARDSFKREGDVFLAQYTGGTAVVIRTDLFRMYGLPYLQYESMLGDLTLLFRQAARDGRRIGWSTKTFARLLDLQYDNGPTTPDYAEYDAEVAAYRKEGNDWWSAMGGMDGIEAWISNRGGRDYLA